MLTLNLNILWTVVNILVLFVLLRKFLYRPVMNVIEQRQKQIDDAIADAEGKKNDAQAVLAQAQDKLQNVDTEAAQRREAYEKQAEVEKQQLLAKRKNSFCRTPSAKQMRLWPKAKPLPKQSMPAVCAMPMLKLPPWPAKCAKSCWRAT